MGSQKKPKNNSLGTKEVLPTLKVNPLEKPEFANSFLIIPMEKPT